MEMQQPVGGGALWTSAAYIQPTLPFSLTEFGGLWEATVGTRNGNVLPEAKNDGTLPIPSSNPRGVDGTI